MRKLVLSMGVSLDGLVARPGRYGAGGWGLPPEDPALTEHNRLMLQPVVLGQGLPLFKDLTSPLQLELIHAQTYPTGAALHVYRPAAAAS